jgi:uncharacterized membrane protein YadS
MALGTVFILNSVALLLFPRTGFALHLSQNQFGLWSALAIHDTSSVVGAAASGTQALQIGTTVKLARTLCIAPIAMLTAHIVKSKARIPWPWFILLFYLATVANTYLAGGAAFYPVLSRLGRCSSVLGKIQVRNRCGQGCFGRNPRIVPKTGSHSWPPL